MTQTTRSGRAMMQGLHAALTDISIDVIHCFADGDDVVAAQKIVRGRQVGDWMGRPPTGQRVGLRIMAFLRFDDGRIVEHWSAHSLADESETTPPASS